MTEYFNGMKVIVAGHAPVLQLSDSFRHCSDEFREETNTWLRNLFGVRCAVERGRIYIMGRNTVVVHPDDLQAIKEATRPSGKSFFRVAT